MAFWDLFKKKAKRQRLSGYYSGNMTSAKWNKDAWDHDTFRAIVDTIATHAAKGQVQHVIVDRNGKTEKTIHNSKIAYLLNQRPNEYMSAFDLMYRFFAQLEVKSTAMMYIDWGLDPNKKVEAKAIYPIDFNHFEIREVVGGGYAVVFSDMDNQDVVCSLEDVIIMRKFYMSKAASGDGNGPVYKVLDMSVASDEGFIESLNKANKIRGILKKKNGMLKSEDLITGQTEFTKRFEAAAQNGGLIEIDSTEDYTPVELKNYSATAQQMEVISERMHTYMRTPKEIVQSKYSEQQGLAWYESVIEPLWNAFAQAVMAAYFTKHEYECGNRLIVSAGLSVGTSLQTRVNIISQTKEIGLFTINEQRELLGYAPVEGGDIRQVSLNYINANNQDQYQLTKKEDEKDATGTGK